MSKTDEFEVEFEPTLDATDAETETSNKQTASAKRNVAERQQDIAILHEYLPDLRLNRLTNKIEYGPRTSPTVMSGNDIETLTVKLAMEHNVFIPEQRIRNAVRFAAETNRYCPIKRYLMDCAFKGKVFEQWDQLGEILIGNSDPVATTTLQKFLVGAVARAYKPGCSMSWIPILIGAQGCGKSQLIRELIPQDLFAEITTSMDVIIKEIYRLHVAWIIELPEVDNYFSVKNIEYFKNLITVRTDETRMPYQMLPTSLERQFVMIGTSNRSEFLVDPSGNRRFMPLEIPLGFETPWRQLPKIRDSIWARAIQEYEKGFEWELTSGDVVKMSHYVQQFNVVDPWEQLIHDYIEDKDEVTATDVLINALSFAPQAASAREAKRVTGILTQMGWRRQITTRKGKSVRLWQRPKTDGAAKKKILDF